ncbi:MAG: UxaA family hydrolase [Rhodospirillales bacterium]|jgi:altronate dehydratase small subunit|nr:UxaA family hydrolase [Rhodospirillales bacterium]
MSRALVLNSSDTVAVALASGVDGTDCALEGAKAGTIKLQQQIPFGHKVAIRQMAQGEDVIKYGQIIGRATAAIEVGEHVHIHNVESLRGRGDLAGG